MQKLGDGNSDDIKGYRFQIISVPEFEAQGNWNKSKQIEFTPSKYNRLYFLCLREI